MVGQTILVRGLVFKTRVAILIKISKGEDCHDLNECEQG